MTTIDQARVVFSRLERELIGRPQVTGIEIASLQIGNTFTDNACVRVLVNSPTVTHESLNLPKELDGVVIEVRYRIVVPQ